MGQFANTLFSALMGWVRTAAAWLWALVTTADAGAWFTWLTENWLPLTLLLCLICVAVDFLVYLIRWQPYRVWRSFLHRLTARDAALPEEQPQVRRQWIYADGTVATEEPSTPPTVPMQEEQLDAPLRPVRRALRHASPEQAYHQPVYPPKWQHTPKDEHGGTP